MRSPSQALVWELGYRHRWALAAALAYLAVLVALCHILPVRDLVPDARFGLGVGGSVPLLLAMLYVVAAFSHGFESDVEGPDSCLPARLFALPVRTTVLVAWPMACGTLAVVLLWLSVARFVLRPCGVEVPLLWPALLLAAFTAWAQALLWMPFGLPWLRLAVSTVLLSVFALAPELTLGWLGLSPAACAAVFAGLVPLAYGAAVLGVARARRGDGLGWAWLPELRRRAEQLLPYRRRPFATAAGAQLWCEWRRHGTGLPLVVACLLPLFVLGMARGQANAIFTLVLLIMTLMTPVLIAGLAGTLVGKHNSLVRDYYGVPAFTATRPLTSGSLIAAKLKAAALATLVTWLLVASVVTLTLVLTDRLGHMEMWWQRWHAVWPAERIWATLLLGAASLLVLTWKRLVQGLCLNLTGKEWLIKGSLIGGLCLFFLTLTAALWLLVQEQYHAAFLGVLPWVLGPAAVFKLALGVGVLWALLQRGHVGAARLALLLGAWLLAAISAFAVLVWLVPRGAVSVPLLAFVVVLSLPLVRVAAAPLTLAGNRHR
jgi:hypothetical protein